MQMLPFTSIFSSITLSTKHATGDEDEVMLNVLRCQRTYLEQAVTNARAWFNIALRPRKPEGLSGRTAQDSHLNSHTAPELCTPQVMTFQHSSTATSIKLLGDGVGSVCV